MLDSVRVRLTLWYTGLLAVFLLGLALATYLIFWRSTVERTDSNLEQLADAFLTTADAELPDIQGPDAEKYALREAIVEHNFRDHIFVVLNENRDVVASSADLPAKSHEHADAKELISSEAFREVATHAWAADFPSFENVRLGHSRYRVSLRRFGLKGRAYMLLIFQSLRAQNEMLEEVRSTFAWVIPLAILLSSLGGYFLARKSLAPVVAMSDRAGHISAANLHERLPVQNAKDELGRLAASFNQLLERVSESFERQRRFMADASHELRTPAAILRGESEVALSREARPAEEYRESLRVLHAEARRLTQIVEDLFTLTRADAGQYPLSPHEFYLDELVTDCVHTTRSLAQAKRITLSCDTAEDLAIWADETLLRRMILNLLDNAIKYSPEGGAVRVACQRSGEEYELTVTDTGPGIPAELQHRVFERFFRADKARTRSEKDGGAGLGLSIARWIAEAHQGRLVLSRSDAHGSTFTVVLPAHVRVATPTSAATR
jgi:two-component system OmpR family sensor kinase